MAKNKTPKAAAKVAGLDALPRDQRSPPSSPTHRVPDLFKLSEYDFEELCEELVRDLEGDRRAAPKNRRGNPQFGVDVEGFSVRQKPFAVLSAKRERRVGKAKLKKWSDHFLDHIGTHWKDKGVERFILGCAEELRGDQVNEQISAEASRFEAHGIVYEILGTAMKSSGACGHVLTSSGFTSIRPGLIASAAHPRPRARFEPEQGRKSSAVRSARPSSPYWGSGWSRACDASSIRRSRCLVGDRHLDLKLPRLAILLRLQDREHLVAAWSIIECTATDLLRLWCALNAQA